MRGLTGQSTGGFGSETSKDCGLISLFCSLTDSGKKLNIRRDMRSEWKIWQTPGTARLNLKVLISEILELVPREALLSRLRFESICKHPCLVF